MSLNLKISNHIAHLIWNFFGNKFQKKFYSQFKDTLRVEVLEKMSFESNIAEIYYTINNHMMNNKIFDNSYPLKYMLWDKLYENIIFNVERSVLDDMREYIYSKFGNNASEMQSRMHSIDLFDNNIILKLQSYDLKKS